MTTTQKGLSRYKQTNTGSIDYQYYDQRSRNIRSESVWKFLNAWLSDKKNSLVDVHEDCEARTFNQPNAQQQKFK